MFYNSPADFPIGFNQNIIDGPESLFASPFKELADILNEIAVIVVFNLCHLLLYLFEIFKGGSDLFFTSQNFFIIYFDGINILVLKKRRQEALPPYVSI